MGSHPEAWRGRHAFVTGTRNTALALALMSLVGCETAPRLIAPRVVPPEEREPTGLVELAERFAATRGAFGLEQAALASSATPGVVTGARDLIAAAANFESIVEALLTSLDEEPKAWDPAEFRAYLGKAQALGEILDETAGELGEQARTLAELLRHETQARTESAADASAQGDVDRLTRCEANAFTLARLASWSREVRARWHESTTSDTASGFHPARRAAHFLLYASSVPEPSEGAVRSFRSAWRDWMFEEQRGLDVPHSLAIAALGLEVSKEHSPTRGEDIGRILAPLATESFLDVEVSGIVENFDRLAEALSDDPRIGEYRGLVLLARARAERDPRVAITRAIEANSVGSGLGVVARDFILSRARDLAARATIDELVGLHEWLDDTLTSSHFPDAASISGMLRRGHFERAVPVARRAIDTGDVPAARAAIEVLGTLARTRTETNARKKLERDLLQVRIDRAIEGNVSELRDLCRELQESFPEDEGFQRTREVLLVRELEEAIGPVATSSERWSANALLDRFRETLESLHADDARSRCEGVLRDVQTAWQRRWRASNDADEVSRFGREVATLEVWDDLTRRRETGTELTRAYFAAFSSGDQDLLEKACRVILEEYPRNMPNGLREVHSRVIQRLDADARQDDLALHLGLHFGAFPDERDRYAALAERITAPEGTGDPMAVERGRALAASEKRTRELIASSEALAAVAVGPSTVAPRAMRDAETLAAVTAPVSVANETTVAKTETMTVLAIVVVVGLLFALLVVIACFVEGAWLSRWVHSAAVALGVAIGAALAFPWT